MIPDTQAKEILKTMKQGFKKIDERFDQVDQRLEKVDARLAVIDERLDKLEMGIAQHDHTLKTLVTREEFDRFRKEDILFKHKATKKLEDIEEAVKDSTRFDRRLDRKVNKHEDALKKHHLLEPVLA